MKRSKSSFPLLSLPELVLMAVVKCLNQKDRWSLASSCRALAIAVSAALQDTRLTVTSKTRWKGLCKVLTTNTITVKTLVLEGEVSSESPVEDNALDVLMNAGAEPVSGCSFRCIDKLIIDKVKPLPCLLPPNLVQVLPGVKEVYLACDTEQFADPQPISYCCSLCKLEYMSWSSEVQLPSKYHTAEDLRRQLPNITSLAVYNAYSTTNSAVAHTNCIKTMLQAWGGQLTELELHNIDTAAQLQHCTRLQSLTWYPSDRSEPSLNFILKSLTKLNLMFRIRESDLQTILQYPLLSVVEFSGIKESLQQDWSNHPCIWQQLSLYRLNMVELSKLPLHSLKGPGCLKIKRLELPDPLLPNSLTDVTHAARRIHNAGLDIDDCHDMHCELWDGFPVDTKQDIAMVDLVHAASSTVRPFEQFSPDNYYLSNYPKATTAVIKWASECVSSVDLRIDYEAEPLPWLWVALQCCRTLETVNFYLTKDFYEGCDLLSTYMQLAAEHYVTITGRRLKVHVQLFSNLRRTVDIQETLQLKLQQQLPNSARLLDFTWDETQSKLTMRIEPS